MKKMNLETQDILYGGAAHRPAESILLKAGPLKCLYEAGYLRYLKIADTEWVRMIYPAVRDHNWGTVAPRISNERVDHKNDHFEIHYDCRYQEGEIDFQAHFHIHGDKEGNIEFAMQGEALTTFRKNRIGFNILHPPEAAEAPCLVRHTSGEKEKGIFPKFISPHQPFMDIKSFRWKMGESWGQIDYEGDVFEMEDQRNWTDASFKTYSTPLGLPFPVTVQKGEKIHQAVRFSVENVQNQPSEEAQPLVVSLGKQRYSLPNIGISQSSEISSLTEEDLKYLSSIRFSHYRVDLKLNQQDAAQQWKRAVKESAQLKLPLELAVHFDEDHVEEALEKLGIWIKKDQPSIRQLLIFSVKCKSTPKHLLQATLPILRKLLPDTQIGAGTDCFFTELNRERVSTEGLDFLSYSFNPQVHQFDNQSLVETLQAQGLTVLSAKQFSQGLPIHVSPVTLKMRFNPNATGPEPEVKSDQLPPQVDTRQMSLFGAGWILGSLKYLTESGLKSVTYFETLGRRGIMQGAHEALLPEKFKVGRGMLYPMYWVLHWLLQHEQVEIIHAESSNVLQMEALAWETQGERRMMLANFQPETLEVEVRGWKDQYEMKTLDAEYFEMATQRGEKFMASAWKHTANPLKLTPYAVCLLR